MQCQRVFRPPAADTCVLATDARLLVNALAQVAKIDSHTCRRHFFKATMSPVTVSLALYTLPYVPSPSLEMRS